MNASAYSEYSKFEPYLFDPNNFYKHGKIKLLKAGAILSMMLNGYRLKWSDKQEKIHFW